MKYIIYKFKFTSPIHFGANKLEESLNHINADTIFAAMCIEAKKIYGEEKIEAMVTWGRKNQLMITDALPYQGEDYYLPKPIVQVKQKEREKSETNIKKKLKKMDYIKLEEMDDFLKGNFDFEKEYELIGMGRYGMRQNVYLREEEAKPFNIGLYKFNKGFGLYILVGVENADIEEQVEKILESLSYTGIGGKLSSGLGKFQLLRKKLPESYLEYIEKKSERYMSLSISLPQKEELGNLTEEDSYLLLKRSGFVTSEDYAKEYQKKKNLFMFQSGSCFKRKYEGDIYDVENGGSHKVYKYGKPFWIGV